MKRQNVLRDIVSFKYSMMYPVLFTLIVVILLPLLYSLYISFHKYVVQFGLGKFLFLNNYVSAIRDGNFIVSMKNTFVLTISVISLELSIAMILALVLNRDDIKGKTVYTIVLMIPIMMPPIAVGLIWRLLLNPDLGIVNYFLQIAGFGKLGWYGDVKLAMLTVIGVDVWHETALILIILLAGLTSLDKTPYEAAQIDGATSFQIFRYITLPMLTPIITVAILIRMISAIKTYDLIYVLTAGGPGFKTETMSFYVYKMAFRKLSMGDAAAQSFILLIIILFFSLVLVKAMEEKKEKTDRRSTVQM